MQPSISVHPTIKLEMTDWLRATWRPYMPLPRPKPAPFDQQAACERLMKARGSARFSWKAMRLPPIMSREEAHFWLLAKTFRPRDANSIPTFLTQRPIDGDLTIVGVEKLLTKEGYDHRDAELIIPLANLLSLPDLCHLMTSFRDAYSHHVMALAEGFRDFVLPYLTEDDRNQVRDVIRPEVENASALGVSIHPMSYDLSLYLAALVGGFSHELQSRLAALPENSFYTRHIYPYGYYRLSGIDLIFGLDDPTLVEKEARRLGHPLCQAHHVAGWLAHTETCALDWIYDSLLIVHKKTAEDLFRVFARVEDEAAVPWLLRLQHDSPVVVQAVGWLKTHADISARAAATAFTAENANAALSREAKNFLLGLKRSGHDALLAGIRLNDEAAQTRFQAEILNSEKEQFPPFTADNTPSWLTEAAASLQTGKRLKLPAWLDGGELPALRLGEHTFNREQMNALLLALSRSTLESPHPVVAVIKTRIEGINLDTFVWSLFQMWLDRGASNKDKWAFLSLGLLGGDASIMRLTPLIRKWPGESQHYRAIMGLNCLRAIGTDTALSQISAIGQKLKYKALKEAARKGMEAIAVERGLNREELADRIVPDCGLDADGQRVFDYGHRQFTLVVNSELKPVIRGEDGKIKNDLPKPNAQDDASKADLAQAEWKLLKKQVRDVAKTQAERLEGAMMARRRWKVNAFELYLVHHPLMTHLVRSLVWGGYGEDRSLRCTFRVTDEKDYADVEDTPISLDDVASVGLIHPLQLSEAHVARWGQLLSDYDRVPPFAQLSRKTYALTPDECEGTEITRYATHPIPAITLVGVLQRLGWVRGAAGDAGFIVEHVKSFEEDGVTAVIQYPGVPVGDYQGWQDQTINACLFVPGVFSPHDPYAKHEKRLKLGSIDPVVMSEVLRDLALLSHKSGA